MKKKVLIEFGMSWKEYSNQWLPFVKQYEREWDMSYSKGIITISCPEDLYNNYINN